MEIILETQSILLRIPSNQRILVARVDASEFEVLDKRSSLSSSFSLYRASLYLLIMRWYSSSC